MHNNFNPWHNVSPGYETPGTVNGIIEIPKGTRAKYELENKSVVVEDLGGRDEAMRIIEESFRLYESTY